MPLACSLFAAQVSDPQLESDLMRRAELVRRYLAPFGCTRLSARFDPATRSLTGGVRFDGLPLDFSATMSFGQVPASLCDAETLRNAADRRLRDLDGLVVAVAVSESSTVLVTGTTGPVSLYRAQADGVEAFSTHAVVAALLARGHASIDTEAIVELLAFQFVGGRRTSVAGVEPVAAAMRIELTAGGAASRTYWPPADRWALMDPHEAQSHGEAALLTHLDRRLEGLENAFLGLTAGLDSRVVALALSELGRPVRGFTWGEEASDDAQGARLVAGRLELEHQVVPTDFYGASEVVARAPVDVRWTEGTTHIALAEQRWPRGMSGLLTGGGGEIGRCFYLALDAQARHEEPTAAKLAAFLAQVVSGRLAGADEQVVAVLRERASVWVGEAETAGHSGWSCLDVVYGEQRFRRWGRAMQPRTSWAFVSAFGTPEVARALLSTSVEDRLASGFHRRFIEDRVPELSPPRAPAPSAPRGRAVRAALRRVGVRRPGNPDPRYPTLLTAEIADRDDLRAWLADEIVGAPVLAGVLGHEWVQRTQSRISEGDGLAEDLALWAAGPVLLGSVLRDLPA